ncbi:MAG: alkaline phosphatase family protein [Gemmatimonadota bacterium]
MRAVVIAVGVLSAAVSSLLLLDRVNPPPVVVDPGIASVDTTKRSRLLILHVDSWRYETAIDSTIMPNVARLRRRGASWEMETVFEGFTIPAVRAAFSGHAETQLVNLIQNFRFRSLGIESFFLDASRLGKRTVAIAYEPWVQFGPYIEHRAPPYNGDQFTADRLRAVWALQAFRDEGFDVVISHYEWGDWAAHTHGIDAARYRSEFAYADSMIASFDAARAPNDYLLVYGDHGHSPTGEHKTGIHIPTFALLLGPDVTPGVTVGPLATTNLRYVASHALGITLRATAYDVAALARFLPIAGGIVDSVAGRARGPAPGAPSRAPLDYALALGVAAAGLALARQLARGAPGIGLTVAVGAALTGLIVLELVVQQVVSVTATVFPVLLGGLAMASIRDGPATFRTLAAGALVLSLGFAIHMAGTSLMVPSGLATVIPLYVAAIATKYFVLLAIAGHRRWREVAVWTTLSTLVELRVWDSPIAFAILVGLGVSSWWRRRDPDVRRLSAIVVLSALMHFTLRAPLYHLAWIDLFLGALWVVSRRWDNAWTDALVVSGSFALASGWLASGLEWGFLYTVFPAYLVELQVQYFLPFILAKLPIPLVLALVVIGRAPTRRFVEVVMLYAGLRFVAAWVMRLGGAAGVEIWPLAEQGIYLTTFLIAAVLWNRRTKTVVGRDALAVAS